MTILKIMNASYNPVVSYADLVRRMDDNELARFLHDVSCSGSLSADTWLSYLTRHLARPAQLRVADIYRARLVDWIISNESRFTSACSEPDRWGKYDESFVCVTNVAFQQFCALHLWEPLDVLRALCSADYIVCRQHQKKGGYYRSARIGTRVRACVWLIRHVSESEWGVYSKLKE